MYREFRVKKNGGGGRIAIEIVHLKYRQRCNKTMQWSLNDPKSTGLVKKVRVIEYFDLLAPWTKPEKRELSNEKRSTLFLTTAYPYVLQPDAFIVRFAIDF